MNLQHSIERTSGARSHPQKRPVRVRIDHRPSLQNPKVKELLRTAISSVAISYQAVLIEVWEEMYPNEPFKAIRDDEWSFS